MPIRPWHNVPVLGWLLLRGRCADCAAPISVRYPLVELGTAALFVAVTARFGWSAALPAWLYFAAIAVALALIDLDVLRLPNAIVLPSYLVVPALLVRPPWCERDWSAGLRGLVGMAVLFTFYLLLSLVYPGGMGFGDVKLAGVLGLYLGWLGWAPLAVGTFAGVPARRGRRGRADGRRRAGRKTALPFGPSMLAGALIALFAAAPITDWYTSILLPA